VGDNNKTKIILLTGFLGAGKTTFLKRLLDDYKDEKISVIINEFGKVNIDAKLVKGDGIELAELSNGSVFCACIKDKFVDTLIEMAQKGFTYLFIEASGLADPSNMAGILNGIKQHTGDGYLLEGAVCIVDGQTFLDMVEILPALERQVKYANAIIVNKADLIDEEQYDETVNRIKQINDNTQIYKTSYCEVDIRTLVNEISYQITESEETTNTFESRPPTVILHADEKVDLEKLTQFTKAVAPHTFRIKGFVDTTEGVVEVSAVGENVQITPWDRDEKTELVIISSVGIKLISIVIKEAKEILDNKLYM